MDDLREGLDVYDIRMAKDFDWHKGGVIFCFGLTRALGAEEH